MWATRRWEILRTGPRFNRNEIHIHIHTHIQKYIYIYIYIYILHIQAEGRGHDRGPPHIHTALAFVTGLAATKLDQQAANNPAADARRQQELLAHLEGFASPLDLAYFLPAFRVKLTYKARTQAEKQETGTNGTDKKEQPEAVLTFAFRATAAQAPQFARDLEDLILARGGQRKAGAPPPDGPERGLRTALRHLSDGRDEG